MVTEVQQEEPVVVYTMVLCTMICRHLSNIMKKIR